MRIFSTLRSVLARALPSRRPAPLARALSRASSLDSLDSVDSFRAHLACHGQAVRARAHQAATLAGARRPAKLAKRAAKAAVAAETARLQAALAARATAQRVNSRARVAVQRAALTLRQAERRFGADSPAARAAAQVHRAAIKAQGAASADLYLASLI